MHFLLNEPALLLPELRALCIADLHLGFEVELANQGIRLPPQLERFKLKLREMLSKTRARRLVLLGDVKHKVPGVSRLEVHGVVELLESLKEYARIYVVPGNHDSSLKEVLPAGIKLHKARGFRLGRFGFFHGHAWPARELFKCKALLMGHVHPAVEFVSKCGYRSVEPVWAEGRVVGSAVKRKFGIKTECRVLILPAFNRLLGGTALNNPQLQCLGPLLRSGALRLGELKLYTLDGSLLGKVSPLLQ